QIHGHERDAGVLRAAEPARSTGGRSDEFLRATSAPARVGTMVAVHAGDLAINRVSLRTPFVSGVLSFASKMRPLQRRLSVMSRPPGRSLDSITGRAAG